MPATLPADVYQDDIALSLARVMATANARARSLGVDVAQSLISITRTLPRAGQKQACGA